MTRPCRKGVAMLVTLCGLVACSGEQRPLATRQPVTPPHAGPEDPRVPLYQDNRYQVSQGGRYFVWYGCGTCHDAATSPALDLTDREWRHGEAFVDVYGYIGHGHAGIAPFDDRIPVEQLWQITAYVRSLPYQRAGMNRRQAVDLSGEPRGSTWAGPLR